MSRLKAIFVGPAGLRPGFGVLLFVAVIATVAIILRAVIAPFHAAVPTGELQPGWLLLGGEGVALVVVLGATALMARIERRSPWDYGLRGPDSLRNLRWGVVGGMTSLSLLVGILAAGGYLKFDGMALNALPALGYGLIWWCGFFLVSMVEETLSRGYLLQTLVRAMGFWPAAVLLSLLFGLLHTQNQSESLLGIATAAAAGLMFCVLVRVTGTLWMGIGFHAAWDWAQSYFYGTPDSGMLVKGHLLASHAAGNVRLSGGAAGPEGSLLSQPILVVGVLVLVWVYGMRSASRRSA